MDYLSYDLRLDEWEPGRGTGVAEVLQSPAGESGRYRFALDGELGRYLPQDRQAPRLAADLGRRLTAGVLAQESLSLWRESYQIARERGRGLRLRLHIDSWDLARLPWELLYDTRRGDFYVFDPMISLVRYVRLPAAPPALRQSRTLRVLAAVAAPIDQPPLDWERELAYLHDALHDLDAAEQVELAICSHLTPERLHQALAEHTPDVIHFIGHGEYRPDQRLGLLMLENEYRRSVPVAAADAARTFRRYSANLVVLNACETAQGAWAGLAPALVRADIPAVVAMQWPIEDRAAICFSRSFYRALAQGKTVDECLAEGRMGVHSAHGGPGDWASPVLFLRSLSGHLWAGQGAAAGNVAPAVAPETEAGRPRGGGARAGSLPASPAPDFIFSTRGPLLSSAGQELIVDRPELRRALRIAGQPSVTQYIAFLSARQTGKTTLLFRLSELLRDRYASVFVDLSVLRAQDACACFRFVAFRLISELRAELGGAAALPDTRDMATSVEFLEFLRELAEAAPLPRFVLLLDEVGALSPEVSDTFFNTLRTVFTQGRGRNSPLAKYLFVFSGAVDLYALTFGTNSPLNICEKLYLRDFEPADVAKIVGEFARLGATVDAAAAERVYEWAGGHPYLTTRLCALMEDADVAQVTPAAVDRAAEQILVEDDNLRHVIRELEGRPAERRRLRAILVEGRQIPFSRNDPVLAALEMIGVVRPTQPVQVRNRLYRQALLAYYDQLDRDGEPAAAAEGDPAAEQEAMYTGLETLRAAALDEQGHYRPGRPWESFAAALFSAVPGFSVLPHLRNEGAQVDVLLAIDAQESAACWQNYGPTALVESLRSGPEAAAHLTEIAAKAARHHLPLVFVVSTGSPAAAGQPPQAPAGQPRLVILPDAEIAALLARRGAIGEYLRARLACRNGDRA